MTYAVILQASPSVLGTGGLQMTDVIEGMARAMFVASGGNPDNWLHLGVVGDGWRQHAQAALDYLKRPQPGSKPTSGQTTQTVRYSRYDVVNIIPATEKP